MESPARSRTFSRGQIMRKSKSIEEENVRLRDMLKQSLSREADALRKLKHLQLKYLEILSKTNGTSLKETPPMDRKTITPYKHSDGVDSSSDSNDDSTQTTFPQFIIHQDHDDKDETGDNCVTENGIDKVSFETNGVASLAPLPQGLRDVKHEREKPPYSLKNKRKTFTRSPVQVRPLLGVTNSLKNSKQKSFSDEHINELHRLNSEPLSRSNGSNKPFWKKKNRQVVDSEETNLSFENLFKRFQESSYIQPDPLKQYLDQHWSNICLDPTCTEQEKKYRDAVWEIFQAETKFLTCQLQPLEQVYKNFLEELQFHGIMSDISVEKIFGNLSELIELTSSTANDFLKLFEHRSPSGIAQPSELILTFSMFGHNFSPVYKLFCTNYDKQQCYVKEIEKMFYFQEYTRVCRKAPSVQKNGISDLLITPMQHQFHYKLLLENVLKHTKDPNHRSSLASVIQAFKVSLQELDSAIAANKTSLELKDLNNLICWPAFTQSIPETFIPPSLWDFTKQQKCTDIITEGRYLILQGLFKLLDSKGKPTTDMQLILLNGLLLVTEVKYGANKRSYQYELLRQPFELNYLKIHRPPATLRPMLILIPHSALGQQLSIFSLVAPSLTERDKWITELLSLGSNFI